MAIDDKDPTRLGGAHFQTCPSMSISRAERLECLGLCLMGNAVSCQQSKHRFDERGVLFRRSQPGRVDGFVQLRVEKCPANVSD
jgi:hypothetical protein